MDESHTCILCHKRLKGRSDKKFCDDFCRNAYNNEKTRSEHLAIRTIDLALKKNRRILKSLLGSYKTKIVEERKMLQKGMIFKYATHRFQNAKESVYYFVYDYGYTALDDKKCMIVKDLAASNEQ